MSQIGSFPRVKIEKKIETTTESKRIGLLDLEVQPGGKPAHSCELKPFKHPKGGGKNSSCMYTLLAIKGSFTR